MKLTSKPKGTSADGPMETDRFVFLASLGEFRVVIWDTGPGVYPALLGTWKRISATPHAAQW